MAGCLGSPGPGCLLHRLLQAARACAEAAISASQLTKHTSFSGCARPLSGSPGPPAAAPARGPVRGRSNGLARFLCHDTSCRVPALSGSPGLHAAAPASQMPGGCPVLSACLLIQLRFPSCRLSALPGSPGPPAAAPARGLLHCAPQRRCCRAGGAPGGGEGGREARIPEAGEESKAAAAWLAVVRGGRQEGGCAHTLSCPGGV